MFTSSGQPRLPMKYPYLFLSVPEFCDINVGEVSTVLLALENGKL